MTRPLVPDNIARLAPYEPGKPIEDVERELGIGNVLKLASNENPLGPSPRAVEAAGRALAKVNFYPDGGSTYLKERLAARLGVTTKEVLVGSGSSEIIELLIRTFCGHDDEVLTYRYSFIMYPIVCQAAGVPFVEAPCEAAQGFTYDVDALLAKVTPRTKLVLVANPNNPTGAYLPRAGLERLLRELPAHIILGIDEAYREYVMAPDYSDALAVRGLRERLVVMRTFSKIYGLAGLRVGYAYAPPSLGGFTERVRLPFNVSLLGQAGALAALDDDAHVERSRGINAEGMRWLSEALRGHGLGVTPSQGNFVLIELPEPSGGGQAVFQRMMRRGVIVRSMASYGLPRHIRVTIGRREDNERMLAALLESLSA